ncbi:MAG: hypothetical protein AAFY60_15985, partial [Myxococcota bacterium]
ELGGDNLDAVLGDVRALTPSVVPFEDIDDSLPPGLDPERDQEVTRAVTSVTQRLTPDPMVRSNRWTTRAVALALLALGVGVGALAFSRANGLEGTEPPAPPIPVEPLAKTGAEELKPAENETPAESVNTNSNTSPRAGTSTRTNRPKSRAPRTTKKGKRTQERRATVDPPPPAQPAQAFGHLTVFAEPFARVRVNGKEIGITPIPKHRVQVGEYTVEFIDPVSGAVRTSRRVEVAENSRVRVTDR